MPNLFEFMSPTEVRNEISDQILLEEIRRNKEEIEENYKPKGLDLHLTYPYSDEFEFQTKLEMINLDTERINDIRSGNGFIISDYQPIKKELKAEYGIFSPKYGRTLGDANPFKDKYSCTCRLMTSRIYNGLVCPHCNTRVKFVDDNYGMFGYMVLLKYEIIHPTLYKQLEALIGPQRLINILDIEDQKNEDGFSITDESQKVHKKGLFRKEKGKNEPYYGIGMEEFQKKFVEIIEYYYLISTNKESKEPYFKSLLENHDKIFTKSIPVYTTHLRPFNSPNKKNLNLEGTNAIYNMMSKLVSSINDDRLKIFRKKKEKNQLLFDLQMKYVELNNEIDAILSGKKGNVRQLAGGRFNYSSRCVIIQNPKLRIDQVILPYWGLVDLLQQQIINILMKTYRMSPSDAYNRWYKANIEIDQGIVDIIRGLMFNNHNPNGLPIIINRNPSINRGSMLQMFCVDISFDYVMSLPLQILPLLAADRLLSLSISNNGLFHF